MRNKENSEPVLSIMRYCAIKLGLGPGKPGKLREAGVRRRLMPTRARMEKILNDLDGKR